MLYIDKQPLANVRLDKVSAAQQERLAYIDFHLQFFGKIFRQAIVDLFQITASMAIRDLAKYRDLMPDNMTYSHQHRSHLRQAGFRPLFQFDLPQSLNAMAHQDIATSTSCVISLPKRFVLPKDHIIFTLSLAISGNLAVQASYSSKARGPVQKNIVPHTFVHNGSRWHIRGFDREHQTFRDFVLTRFVSIKKLPGKPVKKAETIIADHQWQTVVTLILGIHPKCLHPETVCKDYAIADNEEIRITTRAALAAYLLREWRVDCSDGQLLNPDEYPLYLKNRQQVQNICDLHIAPGYAQASVWH